MGFPLGASALTSSVTPEVSEADCLWIRHSHIGNAFAVQSISYALDGLSAVFLGSGVEPPLKDLTLLASSEEEALAVMVTPKSSVVPLPSNAGH